MKDLETKWENNKYYKLVSPSVNPDRSVWVDITSQLTIPELEQAIKDNYLTVYQGLTLAYLLNKDKS